MQNKIRPLNPGFNPSCRILPPHYLSSTLLKDIAEQFFYHPNYISALLHKKTGRKFTEILLEKKMEQAVLLLKNTTLSIEEIAAMLRYNNNSNSYKAFLSYYHM